MNNEESDTRKVSPLVLLFPKSYLAKEGSTVISLGGGRFRYI